MADIGEVNEKTGVFGGVELGGIQNEGLQQEAGTIRQVGSNLPAKVGFWNKFKSFWLKEIDWNKEIKIELTPAQQKIEDEINDFLHQDITWNRVRDFLFQDVSFK